MQTLLLEEAVKELRKQYPVEFPDIKEPLTAFEQGKIVQAREIIEYLESRTRVDSE